MVFLYKETAAIRLEFWHTTTVKTEAGLREVGIQVGFIGPDTVSDSELR